MCKHVAATLYGVGVRLDEEPALFFTLRHVDQADLVGAGTANVLDVAGPGAKRTKREPIAVAELESIFGIEIAAERAARGPVRRRRKSGTSKVSRARR